MRQAIDNFQSFKGIPAMTSNQVQDYLIEIGTQWKGLGTAMELGCWLGATSAALLTGLVEVGYDKTFWAFENWIAVQTQVDKAKKQGVNLEINQNTQSLYLDNVVPVYKEVKAIRGPLPGTLVNYNSEPIEVCIFDAPKKNPHFIGCLKTLLPYWIPGITVFGMLDYYFYLRKNGQNRNDIKEPVDFMESHKNHFEMIKDWDNECPVFFRYTKKLVI